MMKNRKGLLPLISGLIVLTIAQIISHYYQLADFVNGSLTGVGIGLLIVATIVRNRNLKAEH